MKENEMSQKLDTLAIKQSAGKLTSAVLNQFQGLDHSGGGTSAPKADDDQGFTFLIKPNLNLTKDNLQASESLTPLARGGANSLPNAIRCMLMPRVAGYAEGAWHLKHFTLEEGLPRSEIVDDHSPFLTLITNNLVSLTGLPSFEITTSSSEEGKRKEVMVTPDGHDEYNGPLNISITVSSISGNPILTMISSWLKYMGGVRYGTGGMSPAPYSIIQWERDFDTRLYRLSTDPTKRWLRQILYTGYLIPVNAPIGDVFNVERDSTLTPGSQQLTFGFEGGGLRWNTDGCIRAFNQTVQTFNGAMKGSDIDRANAGMIHIAHADLDLFKYRRTYPIITEDYEIQWWTSKSEFAMVESDLGLSLK